MTSQRRSFMAVPFLLLAAACGGTGEEATTTGPGAALESELLVSAATSLTDVFAEMESVFETAHPGVDVVLNFGSSSSLRAQILEGAPADVFASANSSNMDQVVEAGEAENPHILAGNLLEIAVPVGNEAGVSGLADFADDDLLIGLCAEEVPCGDFGRQALEKAGVSPAIDSDEPTVRALLTKIEAGELDAGIVYVTDIAFAAGTVEGIEIQEEHNMSAWYPIAVLLNAPNPGPADAFVAFVLSDDGQQILSQFGFVVP